jgi:hypothetical protein
VTNAAARPGYVPCGVVATDDVAAGRHHDVEHLRGLFAGFDRIGG